MLANQILAVGRLKMFDIYLLMKEIIYNLFLLVDDEIIRKVGISSHEYDGSDEEKIKFLQDNTDKDLPLTQHFSLPVNFTLLIDGKIENAIDYVTFRDLANQGHALLLFEKAFNILNVAQNPLVVVTPVKDGKVWIEGIGDLKNSDQPPPDVVHVEKQAPWYQGYIIGEHLHLDKLINDDFISAVRILYNANLYVSSMKLLIICIDTMAYLEYDDVTGNFSKWVDAFLDLKILEITSEELWEFRNSILHMTNLDSRKVKANKVRRLMFYVAGEKAKYLDINDEGKYFLFKDMIDAVGAGIAKWGNSYNTERAKFEILFDRYDRIISDKRMTNIFFKDIKSQ
jgi:hypothetical protein